MIQRVTIRIPAELHEWLIKKSGAETLRLGKRISLNAVIMCILQMSKNLTISSDFCPKTPQAGRLSKSTARPVNYSSKFARFHSIFLLGNSARSQLFPRGKSRNLPSPPWGVASQKEWRKLTLFE